MNIRTRLHISNVVMIVVPVVIAVVVGLACVGIVWSLVTGFAPLGSDALEERFGLSGISAQDERSIKVIVSLTALALVVAIVVAVVLTDRFMTRFVLGHVTGPLGQLSQGVDQVRSGNLSHRIGYDGDDEFKPVCDAFDEMASRLADSVERDRRLEEARKDLIAGMSHDLRGPLTSIRGYAEGLRDGVAADEESRRRYTGVILEKTADMEHKVSELLALTRLDMDGYVLETRSLELDSYARDFVSRDRDDFAAQGMSVTCNLTPVTVEADPAELDRILGNLLDNSLRYRKRDEVSVEIGVASVGGCAVLSVSDDGPGVGERDLARIFEPLYRGDAARSGSREGSGLGLSIVAASASRMGGSASAGRSDAGGLSVEVRLPLAQSRGEVSE
jgi:signal transduction histidine kinase